METKIFLITGLLNSGKTSLINELIESDILSYKKISIIQSEFGKIKVPIEDISDKDLSIHPVKTISEIDNKLLDEIIELKSPEAILIEVREDQNITSLINKFETTENKNLILYKVINVIDIEKINNNIQSPNEIYKENILKSDLIVLNKIESYSDKEIKVFKKYFKKQNKTIEFLTMVKDKEQTNETGNKTSKLKNFVSIIIGSIIIYLTLLFLVSTDMLVFYDKLKLFNTIFLSILIQALPFIFIGIIISSLIQIFISKDTLIKFFPQKKFLGFIVAMFSGILFPVCDCAIVPVTSRLIKKGIPVPTAIVFMLSAPLVNVIVIASTFYAFPNQPHIAFYRIIFGLLIALVVGITFIIFPSKNILLDNSLEKETCECSCSNHDHDHNHNLNKLHQIQSVFYHSIHEFFTIGKYLIIGAGISGFIQTAIPRSILNNISGNHLISLFIMMCVAFLFSVCATSDAFIGKSFLNQFSMGSVMGFIVLGPMIDLKNMLMLTSSFNKKFVLKLIILIFLISFIILYILTSILL
ncbi:MAG: permease [Clostridiales bacterium]